MTSLRLRAMIVAAAIAAVVMAAVSGGASAQAPKTISDIIAVMDQEKMDPKRQAEVQALVSAAPPANSSSEQIFDFYLKRAAAYSSVGRFSDSVKELENAVALGRTDRRINFQRALGTIGNQAIRAGQASKTIEIEKSREEDLKKIPNPASVLGSYRQLIQAYLTLGEIQQADDVLKKMDRESVGLKNLKDSHLYLSNWQASIEDSRARVMEAHGKFREAELSYSKAAELFEETRQQMARWPGPAQAPDGMITSRDGALSAAGVNKARQGKLKEAEIDARRALINELQYFGKYGGVTRGTMMALGNVLVKQGRYADAERLFRRSVDILLELGFAKDNRQMVTANRSVASALALLGRWDDAGKEYDAIAAAMAGSPEWPAAKAENFLNTPDRVQVLYNIARVEDGIRVAEAVFRGTQKRNGEQHYDTSLARGMVAVGYVLSKRMDQAMPLFQASVPVLVAKGQNSQSDDGSGDDALEAAQVRQIVETYIATLAELKTPPAGIDPGTESLKLVDFIRGQSVQRALAASSARAATRDPQLAALVSRIRTTSARSAPCFRRSTMRWHCRRISATPTRSSRCRGASPSSRPSTMLHGRRSQANFPTMPT